MEKVAKANVKSATLIFLLIALIALPLLLLALKLRQRLLPKAATQEAQITIQPAKVEKLPNENFQISAFVTASTPVSGVSLTFAYDANIASVSSFTLNGEKFNDNLSPPLNANPKGKLQLSAVTKDRISPLFTNPVKIADITLVGVAPGETSFRLEKSQIVGPAQEGFTLFTVRQLEPPQIIIQEPAAVPPQISFKLRAFGIAKKAPPLPVRLKIESTDKQNKWNFTAIVSSDNNGIYSTHGWLILSGVIPRQSYNIFVKGPKHLAKKVAEDKILHVGQNQENIMDWTANPLPPGDLPNPAQNNQQDGKIDAKDVSLILNFFGRTDSEAVTVADLNYDGVVNLNDFALLLGTLKTTDRDET